MVPKISRRSNLAKLSESAFTLDLRRLRTALKAGVDLQGLLLAASSAHDPDPQNQRAVIHLLIQQGAEVNETDKNGVTPLHRAVRFRSPTAAKILLENGAEPNAVDRKTNSTPLHRAVTSTGAPTTAGKTQEVEELIQLLLEYGADPRLTNKLGKTPRDYVRNAQLQRLLDRDAKPPRKKRVGRRKSP